MSLDLLPIHKLNKRPAGKKVESRSGDVMNASSIPPRRRHQHMFGSVVRLAGCGAFLGSHIGHFEGQVND